jgi:hypothetical protein
MSGSRRGRFAGDFGSGVTRSNSGPSFVPGWKTKSRILHRIPFPHLARVHSFEGGKEVRTRASETKIDNRARRSRIKNHPIGTQNEFVGSSICKTKNHDGKTRLPIVLFLRGSGQVGTDGRKQRGIGPAPRSGRAACRSRSAGDRNTRSIRGVGHNGWDRVDADEEMYRWLRSQARR